MIVEDVDDMFVEGKADVNIEAEADAIVEDDVGDTENDNQLSGDDIGSLWVISSLTKRNPRVFARSLSSPQKNSRTASRR